MKYKRRDPMGPFFVGKGRRGEGGGREGERERGKEGVTFTLNPLPNLPPRGKERPKPFPLGGNGKGGRWSKGKVVDGESCGPGTKKQEPGTRNEEL
jgi:hypothetical protein